MKSKKIRAVAVFIIIWSMVVSLAAQTGGDFALTQTVIASGGGSSSGSFFSVTSTTGQSAAGNPSSGGTFSLYSGFWNSPNTDGAVFTISGQITSDGNPLAGVLVSLSGSSNHSTFTGSTGNFSFTNLPAAGSYTVTPALTNYSFNPPSQSFATLLSDQTANFTASAQNCSYSIDPTGANAPSAGAAGTITVTTQAGCNWTAVANNSWISITSAMSGTGAGTASYSVEANSGSARSDSITIAGQSFTINQAGAAISIEADVAPRPNGNGTGAVNVGDITQIQRFAVGLDLPFQSNEFQRADCAPRLAQDGTTLQLGNGFINTGDVTQAQRYAVGLDGAPPPAGGPTAPPASDMADQAEIFDNSIESAEAIQAVYEVRAIRESLTATTLTVAIRLDTDASASTLAASVGGTLRFNQTQLSNPTNIRLGSGAPVGTSFFANTSDTANGRLGFTINAPVNQTFPTGEQQLLLIDFTVIGTGATTLSFDSSQAQRFVGDVQGNELTNSEFPPTEISLSPTSATVSVSGRVIFTEGKYENLFNGRSRTAARATVSFIDAQGQTRTRQTNERGYYQFEAVETGYTYVFEVSTKGRRFAPQVVTVNETIDNLNFFPVP